jgi:hypothetical protein
VEGGMWIGQQLTYSNQLMWIDNIDWHTVRGFSNVSYIRPFVCQILCLQLPYWSRSLFPLSYNYRSQT